MCATTRHAVNERHRPPFWTVGSIDREVATVFRIEVHGMLFFVLRAGKLQTDEAQEKV